MTHAKTLRMARIDSRKDSVSWQPAQYSLKGTLKESSINGRVKCFLFRTSISHVMAELFFLHDGEYKQLAIINYISAMQGKCIKYLEGTLIRSAEVVSAKIS